MYEVELKAHVADRNAVIARLSEVAQYCGAVQKDDVYYAQPGGKKARIRTETPVTVADGLYQLAEAAGVPHIFFTYKRKERRFDAHGAAIEVNDEKECELSAAEPLQAYLADNGFEVVLEKRKLVMGWRSGDVHIELCQVPPLGDFLELEVLAERNDAALVATLRKKLCAVLSQAGISEAQIEDRYYSDLLRDAASAHAMQKE